MFTVPRRPALIAPAIRAPALTALVVVSALVLSGCVTPARDASSYHSKALGSIEAAISEVSTARLVSELLVDGRVLHTTADETLTDAESALDSIAGSILSVQPPRGTDDIYLRVSAELDRAQAVVRDVRIAARRSDTARLVDLMGRLDAVLTDLAATEELLA